jgi:hypothetical protein
VTQPQSGAYEPPLPVDGGFCHWDTYEADGYYWSECECGFGSARYRNVVSAMRDAEMHLPYPCMSCGVWRRRRDMQPAVDRMWRDIPNKYVCRSQELCFQEVVKAACRTGDALRAGQETP